MIGGRRSRIGRRLFIHPHKITEITDEVKRQAFIDAGLKPIKREIGYAPGGGPVTINDTFGFFQMSFINAYKDMGVELTKEERRVIREGKRNRDIMASLPIDTVKNYQTHELFTLTRLMDKLRNAIADVGLLPYMTHWQGAGAIAAAMGKKHRERDFFPPVRATNWPMEQEWAHFCFAGGNIQMMKQGRHEGKIFIDDVTSAYPGKLVRLPAMVLPIEWEIKKDGSRGDACKFVHGQWKWRDAVTVEAIERVSPYSMIEIDYDFPAAVERKDNGGGVQRAVPVPWYPLFFRRPDGSIIFPAEGRGRYYRGEILAAFKWLERMCWYMTPEQVPRN